MKRRGNMRRREGSFSILFGVCSALCCSSCDPAAESPDFLHIVYTIWLLPEDELVKMPAQRRRGEGLVTVLALFVFGGVMSPCRWARLMRCFGLWALDHG